MKRDEMKKGQGSLEYLLILAAILAIAVVVVLISSSLLAEPEEATAINEDKYSCAVAGIELIGYSEAYDGTLAKSPSAVARNSDQMTNAGIADAGAVSGNVVCKLGGYDLKLNPGIDAYLETTNPAEWIQYGAESGGGGNQPANVVVMDQFMTTPDGGAFCPGVGSTIANPGEVFDLKFNFTGVDRAAIISASLELWEAFGTNDGVVSISKITGADFGTNTITGTDEQTLAVSGGSQFVSLTLPFAITEDYLYLRVKRSTATYTVYCGKDATETTHRPYIALTY